jgi:hypothetical protein
VLGVVARGLSNREAGGVLHLSEHTVADHLRRILRKTGCANRTQATAYALSHGIAGRLAPRSDPCIDSLMPIFVIERNYAERLELEPEGVREIEAVNADEGVRWVFSFLTADQLKTYCIYEAASADAILAAARRAGLPADVIVEVDRVEAAMFT